MAAICLFADISNCANRAKMVLIVYVKYQKQYKPIYFCKDLLYNEIMNKYGFGISISSWQYDASCVDRYVQNAFRFIMVFKPADDMYKYHKC